jgi:clan AA aspartic protease
MISGHVSDRHALVPVTFRFSDRPDLTIEFVIDTGFTDYLCLPTEAIAVLGLPFAYDQPANLADNSEVLLPVHGANIVWNGEERTIGILGTGRRPLLGTALLDGQELVVQFRQGGLVTINNF